MWYEETGDGSRRSLDTYRRKRDPARTPEPFGAPRRGGRPAAAPRFVVQQHAARRLHWDLRLEIDGVLVSWAVPRGPSVDRKEKRLAVQTEDHPLEYGGFEGIIPAGNYGAGAMILWDPGTYRTVDGGDPRPPAWQRGKLDLELHGHKLRGRWALVRTKGGDGRNWLLFKKADAHRRPAPSRSSRTPASVRLRADGRGAARRRAAATPSSPRCAAAAGAPRARRCRPRALAPDAGGDVAEQPFSRPGWLFELKYDGVRALVVRRAGGAAAPRRAQRARRRPRASRRSPRAAAHLPAATTSSSTASSSPSTSAAPAPSSACSSASD